MLVVFTTCDRMKIILKKDCCLLAKVYLINIFGELKIYFSVKQEFIYHRNVFLNFCFITYMYMYSVGHHHHTETVLTSTTTHVLFRSKSGLFLLFFLSLVCVLSVSVFSVCFYQKSGTHVNSICNTGTTLLRNRGHKNFFCF